MKKDLARQDDSFKYLHYYVCQKYQYFQGCGSKIYLKINEAKKKTEFIYDIKFDENA